MELYLVQHAKAASKQIDPQRPLTEEGCRDIQKVAAFIKPLTLFVDYLWHSGKKRAEQTAEVLAEAIKVKEGTIVHEGLGPNDDVTALKNELIMRQQDIMIVGHLPFLSKLASLLLSGDESANTVAFKNGGIVCLSRSEAGQWQIECMVTPEIID
ncbi:MAG: phosphohistidine phosphatase SixA [Planctomycetota bacterium]|jgi:phosphohistidine phosphatase